MLFDLLSYRLIISELQICGEFCRWVGVSFLWLASQQCRRWGRRVCLRLGGLLCGFVVALSAWAAPSQSAQETAQRKHTLPLTANCMPPLRVLQSANVDGQMFASSCAGGYRLGLIRPYDLLTSVPILLDCCARLYLVILPFGLGPQERMIV